jgi:hypothetical protein
MKRVLIDPAVSLEPRLLFSTKGKQVSVRTGPFRLDAEGRLYDVVADPGQSRDVAQQHDEVVTRLKHAANEHRQKMMAHFATNSDRPFHVGYRGSTTLPARDGIPHGSIQRSAKAPNNSFFKNWTSTDDSITWDVDVGESGIYDASVFYTCASGDVGVRIELMVEEGPGNKAPKEESRATNSVVHEEFDPPLYGKSKDRVAGSHYIVKDFKPHYLGMIQLEKGRAVLRLRALEKPGRFAIDVHSIQLTRSQ